MAKKMCEICGDMQATVPDRERMGRLINRVCSSCHALRLAGDMKRILELHEKRRARADHCAEIARLTADRDNAEKREYELLGRANALEAELKATRARLDASDDLLREEFAQRQDAIAYLTPEQRMEYQAHLNAAARHVADHLAALASTPLMAQTEKGKK